LYFSQQFAVNAALKELQTGPPIFGINGPPGTGKTTLLRDVIAAVVVQRARLLAALPRPEAAFSGSLTHWRSGTLRRSIYPWRDDLLGFGIVVASSNNRAVENITLEIPAERAVAEEYLSEIDHYPDFAARLLAGRSTAWGLISARLGSKRNRRKFVSSFWFDEKDAPEPPSRAQKGFLQYLNTLKAAKPKPGEWKKAVARFAQALGEEEAIRAERIEAWTALEAQTSTLGRIVSIEQELQDAESALCQARAQAIDSERLQAECQREVDLAIGSRRSHSEFKPVMVDALLTFCAAYREWRTKDLLHAAEVEKREREYAEAQIAHRQRRRQVDAISRRIEALKAERESEKNKLATQERLVRDLQNKLGKAFQDARNWLSNPDERERSSPWMDELWNRARSRVFIEALRLHRTFIESVPDRIRGNLSGAMDLLSGKVPPGVEPQALASAWATLFFVIPVISTTFASFDRLFAHLERESIGWLLIDEAGQAVPQAAAGALWRSRRAIVVGDPRQLEPIVTLPFTAQQALRTHFGVEETWMPSVNSVQTLADRVSRLGTWLHSETAEELSWVGSPLRVHRRCEKPMFAISNQIAYDRQMVYDTPELRLSLPPSRWIDVASGDADDHWIPSEGLALELLLNELLQSGAQPSDMLLISPFRAVARHLRQIALRRGIPHSGTIHVSQGREADIVVLVLGGDPRRIGAKEWASKNPNLLNVAVSRAKRRLYIIGDRQEWSQYPYFADAAAWMTKASENEVKTSAARS
jgi:hypothetical protein